jgi:ribose-phosphate pyrophosphokinase
VNQVGIYQLDGIDRLNDLSETVETGIFPAGEPYVKFTPGPWFNEGAPTLVTGSIRCAVDFMTFCETVRAVKLHTNSVIAFIPYFPAARQDRVTDNPTMNLSVGLYADIVNSLGLDQVFLLDPHSPVTPALILGVRKVDAANLCVEACRTGSDPHSDLYAYQYSGVIAPDAGAEKRAYEVASHYHMQVPVYTAGKHRDTASGALAGFSFDAELEPGRYLLVDDICDGGGTFAGLLAKLHEKYGDPELYRFDLWVTHGVFSGNAKRNLKGFDRVITTDSVHVGGEGYKVWPLMTELASLFEGELKK